jgi:hypothetical protein
MEQNQIIQLITAPFAALHDMVSMDTGFTIEPLVTHWTDSALLLPKAPQFASPLFLGFPPLQISLLEVVFPFGVIGIGFSLDFYVPCDGYETGFKQAYRISLIVNACEHPLISSHRFKVILFDPVRSFLGVSSFCPVP